MMKTLFQIDACAGQGSGVGVVADAIAEAFIAGGGRCFMAVPEGKSRVAGVKQVNVSHPMERRVHALLSSINDSQGLHSLRATSALIDEMVVAKPDVVQLHRLHGSYVHVPLLMDFLRRSNVPVVATLHDYWLLTGHCLYPDEAHCERYVTGNCHDCPLRKTYPRAWIDGSRRNVKMKMKMLREFDNLHLVTASRAASETVHRSWASGHPVYTIVTDVKNNANFAQDYMEIYHNVM